MEQDRVTEVRRVMRAFGLAVVALWVSASPAFAQAGEATIGIGVGTGIGLTPDIRDGTDSDIAIQGHLTIGLAGALAVRGEIGQTKFKASQDSQVFCPGCVLEINHFSVGLQYGGYGGQGALGLSNARVLPYGFIGIGWYEFASDPEDQFDFLFDFLDEKRRVGLTGGFGINIRLSDHFGLQADVHVHGVSPVEGVNTAYWFTPQGGIWVGF